MAETLARKATKRIEYDRLGSLPDNVLHHILSFLDMKDVFLTRKLSRKWWKLSTSVSNLNFDNPKQLGEDADFIKFINLALIHNTARKIDKFRLSFDYDGTEHLPAVISWINFAMNKGVQGLDLEFNKYYVSHAIPVAFTAIQMRNVDITEAQDFAD
ncbi:hypothetical protein MRB53_000405 [Persea americana]|uniref:Uncharacterized protein n=1 Tax=Persea americana TaxID=3435 RepID=A0ACC2MNR2_PERAE|nr:hypothetical protein MRB53_000405 [Persea americana]|eukprot:TRINITY_DN11517_c0_g3_i2.p1 TRINITY_DN11517_c0_g3~~TRINITY_DN11517_c0_g3_i2.p1  ORF type:complete len:157 (+),score=18.68 TRINITY_DN11517_c0_g3_i2:995-1465(+)